MPIRSLSRPFMLLIQSGLAAAALLLGGCGGGGAAVDPPVVAGAPTPTPTPTPTPEPVPDPANLLAATAGLHATLQVQTGQLTLRWTDRFSDESGFRIERWTGSTWAAIDTLAALPASAQAASWTGPAGASARWRVLALLPTSTALLHTVGRALEIEVPADAAPPTIDPGAAEPLQGALTLKTLGAANAQAVTYYIDLRRHAESLSRPDFLVPWSTLALENGSHQLLAQVVRSADLTLETRRVVTVANPLVQIRTDLVLTAATRSTLRVSATTAASVVATVQLLVDGVDRGTLVASNACISGWCPGWFFDLDHSVLGAGAHEFTVIVVDQQGRRFERVQTLRLDGLPVIRIDSPFDGQVVRGTLALRGLVSSAQPLARVVVQLGDVVLKSDANPVLDLDIDVAGLPSKFYELSIGAEHLDGRGSPASRKVLVENNTLDFRHLGALGSEGWIYAAEGEQVLVGDGRHHFLLRVGAPGVRTMLTGSSNFSNWRMDGGRVLGQAGFGALPQTVLWLADGRRVDLSALLHPGQAACRVFGWRGAWVGCGGDGAPVVVANLDTGERHVLTVPARASGGAMSPALGVTAVGGAKLVYGLHVGGTVFEDWESAIHVFDTASRTTTRLSALGQQAGEPQTDGRRVAWLAKPQATLRHDRVQWVDFSAPSNVTTISAPAGRNLSGPLALSGAALVWSEFSYSSDSRVSQQWVLQIDSAGVRQSLTLGAIGPAYSASDGALAWNRSTAVEVWRSDGGLRVLLHTIPLGWLVTRDWLFLVVGSGTELYAVRY